MRPVPPLLWRFCIPAEPCGMGGHGDVMTEDPQSAGPGTSDVDDHSAPIAAQQAIERLVVGRTPGVRGDDLWAEAGRKVLRFHLARMFARVPGVIAGEDPEEVHAMRVAARRARAAWRVFGDGFERGEPCAAIAGTCARSGRASAQSVTSTSCSRSWPITACVVASAAASAWPPLLRAWDAERGPPDRARRGPRV